ncbi:hypothetical protein V8F06_002647 [Rhypophila decipiens]
MSNILSIKLLLSALFSPLSKPTAICLLLQPRHIPLTPRILPAYRICSIQDLHSVIPKYFTFICFPRREAETDHLIPLNSSRTRQPGHHSRYIAPIQTSIHTICLRGKEKRKPGMP